MSMTRIAQAAGMDPGLINQVLPWLFGPCYDVPALPACVPVSDTLSIAMTAADPSAGGTIKLSTRAAFDRFPESGTWEIGSERGTWNGKYASDLSLLNITRATGGSTAAPHDVGAAVTAQQNLHHYVICENPRQGGYPIRSVPAIKTNGILKPASAIPVHTVTLDDRALIPGTSVVSVTFDMTPVGTPASLYLTPRFLYLPTPVTTLPEIGLADVIGSGDGASASGAASGQTYDVVLSPTLVWDRPPPPRLVPGPQIGVVTADVLGATDDSTGTITGTAGLPFSTPAHIMKLLLLEAFELSGFDAASWADTVTQQQTRGYEWAMRFTPLSLDQLLGMCQLQSRAAIFRERGVWASVFRRRGATTHVFDSRNMANPVIDWSPVENVLTAFDATYAGGSRIEPLVLPRIDSTVGLARYGLRRAPLDLPWVPSEHVALDLGRYWLSLQDRQRLEVACEGPGWEALPVERYDLAEVDTAVTRAYSVRRMPFRVRGARHNLDSRAVAMAMSEDQPPAIDLDARYAVLAAGGAAGLQFKLNATYAVATDRKTATDVLGLKITEAASVPTIRASARDVLGLKITEAASKTTSTG